jgi:hypothetical protein
MDRRLWFPLAWTTVSPNPAEESSVSANFGQFWTRAKDPKSQRIETPPIGCHPGDPQETSKMPALLRILITAAAILPSASAIADDPFMAIHLDNQKIGSPVASYWLSQSKPASPDGFMAIHRDNQKIGSAVAAYWQAYSAVSAQDGQTAIHMDNQKFNSTVVSFWRSHRTPGQQPGDVAEQR